MKYVLFISVFMFLNLKAMNENEPKRSFLSLASSLNADLLEYAEPSHIDHYLEHWASLKTATVNMEPNDIARVMVTARTAQEMAQAAALKQAKECGLRSNTRVQFSTNAPDAQLYTLTLKYINAQLNYDKICNYLGIKK